VIAKRTYLDGARPIPFAHRGGAALRPENTLLAFGHAHALGYRWMETDVHLTRDGEVAIFHDPTLERTTDSVGPIAERTLAQLRALDAGWRFTPDGGRTFPHRGQGVHIPTLEEVMALAPDVRVNIELKPRDPRIAQAVWERIEAHGWHDRVLVASGHAPTVRAFRRLARGRVATSAGYDEVLAFYLAVQAGAAAWLPLGYDALQVPETHRGLRVVTPELIAAAHARGIAVHVWTVDAPADFERLRALGVDGIMTDRPDLLPSTVAPR
jgi:glycerophosphoryl diester phosphodiesterase